MHRRTTLLSIHVQLDDLFWSKPLPDVQGNSTVGTKCLLDGESTCLSHTLTIMMVMMMLFMMMVMMTLNNRN